MNQGTDILNHREINQKIDRLAFSILEEVHAEPEIVIVGIAPNGKILADKLKAAIETESAVKVMVVEIVVNKDNPFSEPVKILPENHQPKGQTLILTDDVLNSGRTMTFALAHLLQFNPRRIKTAVLVDRDHKDFPIKADFTGLSLSTNLQNLVLVEFGENDRAFMV